MHLYPPDNSGYNKSLSYGTYLMAKKIPIEEILEPHPYNRRRASIAKTHPWLSLEWLYKKNCGWGPEDFSSGSTVAPWWQCQTNKKHIWQSSIYVRTGGHGCPCCTSNSPTYEKSLAKLFPKAALRWHPEMNEPLKPSEVNAHSNQLVWWFCPDCSYEWQAKVQDLTRTENGCFRCSKNIINLRHYPYALKFFDRKANKDVDLTWLDTRTKVHWKCPKASDHIWYQVFYKNRAQDAFCPFCSNRKASKTNCLAKSYPELAEQWHPSKNGKLTPQMVTPGSEFLAWWKCLYCQYSWKAKICNRVTNLTGCPDCWKNKHPLAIEEMQARLDMAYENSKRIAKMYDDGLSKSVIARRIGTSPRVISKILAHVFAKTSLN